MTAANLRSSSFSRSVMSGSESDAADFRGAVDGVVAGALVSKASDGYQTADPRTARIKTSAALRIIVIAIFFMMTTASTHISLNPASAYRGSP